MGGRRLDAGGPAYTFTSMRKLVILGSTGSIGVQALDVVARSDDLAGRRPGGRGPLGAAAGAGGGVRRAAGQPLTTRRRRPRRAAAWGRERCCRGAEGLVRLVAESGADLVLNGLVGSAGLGPTVAALGEGIDVALANKESLVVGGELVMQLAEATGARVIPVDSEHSALFQLLRKEPPGTVERLVLTASGGPFRGLTRGRAARRRASSEALAHPTWDMGGKITIDSATLMNKGLEVIEAHHLFGFPYERIDVVVHPESIVHAIVAPQRRRLARAPGPPGHARPDLLRAALSRSAPTCRCERSTSREVGHA